MTLNHQCAELATLRRYEDETSPELIGRTYGLDPSTIIDFSLNVNPLGSPERAVSAAVKSLSQANRYPDLRYGHLRSRLAERHGVDEAALFFGAGLDDVIKLLLQAWTSEGDEILVHVPTFPRYELEGRLRGCSVVYVESERPEVISAEAIELALERRTVALAFLCSPNNPSGAVIDNASIKRLAVRFPETIFVVDEALIYPALEQAIPLCRLHDNIVVLRTFSKYYGLAGLRIGYAVGPERLIRVAEVGRPPFNMSAAASEAAIAALSDHSFLAKCKEVFEHEVSYFREALTNIPGASIVGSNANMLLIDLGDHGGPECVSRLASMGLIVADASSFRGLEGRNMIRVSLRGRVENNKLTSALRAVLQAQ